MAINESVQYNGGLVPDIILLTQGYYHRGTRLNIMYAEALSFLQPIIPPNKRFDIFVASTIPSNIVIHGCQ